MPRVIDIQRRYMELGRIRLGEKGAKGQPQRLDTWRLTSASKALLDSAAAIYGGTVEEWKDAPDKGYYELTTDTAVLDVMVPPGDAYSQFYELWSGGGCKRRCNGATELLTDSACKCDPEDRECKITTRINVMLPQVAGLGVWRMESHGYYAAAELPDQLDLLQQISGGRIVSGVLRIEQRSSKKDGRTNRYPVPVLDLPNVTLASLTGGQVIVNAPMPLEAGKPALIGTAELPVETEFDGNQAVGFGERPALPPTTAPSEQPSRRTRGELQQAIATAAHSIGWNLAKVDELARTQGIKRGEATAEQLVTLLASIETSGSSVPTDSPATEAPASEGTQTSEIPTDGGSDADVVAPEGVPPSSSGAPTLEDVLAVSGGELVPPKPGSDEYRSLSAMEKSQARAYWARAQPQGARETHEPTQVGAAL